MTDMEVKEEARSLEQGDPLSPNEETSSETWQNELPEDDFPGQGDFHEEAIEETSAESPFAGKGQSNGRGKTVFIGAVVFVALLGGAFAYLQFGSGSSEPLNLARPVATLFDVKEIGKSVEKQAPKPEPEAAATTGKVDLDALYREAQQQNSGKSVAPTGENKQLSEEKPMTSDILTSGSSALPPTVSKVETIAIKPAAPEPVSSESVASVAPMPASPLLSAAKDSTTTTPPTAAVSPDVDNRLNEMAAQIDSLKKALEQSADQNAQLLSRLDLMQSKVAKNAPEKVSSVSVDDQEPAITPKTIKKNRSKSASSKHETKKKNVKKKSAVATSSAVWVLRAATPDAAWVSMGAESPDLRRLAVGESLLGIGKVKEIRQSGEKWEVVGETGTLR